MDAVPVLLDSAVILIAHEMCLSTPTIGVSVRPRVAPPFQDPLQAMPSSPQPEGDTPDPMALPAFPTPSLCPKKNRSSAELVLSDWARSEADCWDCGATSTGVY